MKRLVLSLLLVAAASAVAAPNVTNTVMMVDQRGNLNVAGVATVEDVATNAVRVQIAEAKAAAAEQTASQVSGAIQGVVDNIMSNNMVVYRSGFSDSFAALVAFTDADKLEVCDCRWSASAAQIVVEVDYVSTVNLGTVKPVVLAHNTLVAGDDFDELPDANVSTPVYHAGQRTFKGQTFSGYYTITATIPNPASTRNYFLWLKLSGDAPQGDGTTLDLPNGVTGGVTGDYVWGDKVLSFEGGVLKGVTDAN